MPCFGLWEKGVCNPKDWRGRFLSPRMGLGRGSTGLSPMATLPVKASRRTSRPCTGSGFTASLYMEVDQSVPKGPARFLSPQWREMIQHAVKEATRLGITVNMNNDGGWCGSGGPWITPELSMQMVVWSETALQGPKHFTGTLPQPKTVENYYQDIAVLAFPAPAGRACGWPNVLPS